jgi:hypothetical protein
VVKATPRAALPPRKGPGTHCIGNLVGPMTGLDECGKFRLPIGIRSAVGPAGSKSLYLLSYPGPHIPSYVSVKYASLRTCGLPKVVMTLPLISHIASKIVI